VITSFNELPHLYSHTVVIRCRTCSHTHQFERSSANAGGQLGYCRCTGDAFQQMNWDKWTQCSPGGRYIYTRRWYIWTMISAQFTANIEHDTIQWDEQLIKYSVPAVDVHVNLELTSIVCRNLVVRHSMDSLSWQDSMSRCNNTTDFEQRISDFSILFATFCQAILYEWLNIILN